MKWSLVVKFGLRPITKTCQLPMILYFFVRLVKKFCTLSGFLESWIKTERANDLRSLLTDTKSEEVAVICTCINCKSHKCDACWSDQGGGGCHQYCSHLCCKFQVQSQTLGSCWEMSNVECSRCGSFQMWGTEEFWYSLEFHFGF